MTALMVSTGLVLLVGSGAVSLPPPSGQAVLPPDPPEPPAASGNWYEEVWAYRDGTGVGPRVGSFTPAATWASGRSGVSIGGSTVTISGSGITATGVDFTGYKLINNGSGNVIEDCIGDFNAAGQGGTGRQWDIGGANPIVRYCRITNPNFLSGIIGYAFHDASGVATLHNCEAIDAAGQDPIKGPGAGVVFDVRDNRVFGIHLSLGAHIDMVDMRLADPGSSVRRTIIVGDATATSVPSQTSTGYTNAVRQSPGDFSGAGGIGITVEECICVGHDDPGAQSALFSIGSGDTTPGNRMYDVLVDLREHNSILFPGIRIDDWYVRTFDYAASVTAGQVTGISAPVAYPHLATFPAQVPSQMAAPVLTAAPGGFTYAAMARPLNMRSLITGYTLEWSTNGTTWTPVAADLAGGFVYTGAASNVRARVYATNGVGNSTVSSASNILATVTAATVSLTALPFDGFVFDAAGAAAATAVLRGTATPGAYVEARGEGSGGNTPWAETMADGSGNWAVALSVDTDAGEWYAPAARIKTADATKVTSANTFAGGTVVILTGQSEIEHIVGTGSSFNNNPYPTLLAQNLTMVTQANTGGRVIRRVTATGTALVNVAMVALANLFHRARPGHKLMVIDNAVSGTSRRALHNDADTARNWSDMQVTLDEIRAAGGEIGGYIECWYNADAAYIPGFGTNWSPNYMGQRWGGGAFSLGTVNPDKDLGRIDHILWDVTAATDAYGRAAFKRDRTKLHMMLPMPFADEPSGGGWATSGELYNFTHVAPGTTRTGSYPPNDLASYRHEDMDLGRVDVETFGADSRVQTFLGAVGPSAHLSDYAGGIHPLTDDPLGTPQFGMMFAPSILRCSGYAMGEPTIDTAGVVRGSGGAYADVPVWLPNGGTLTTLRAIASIAAPGVEPPHYQPVVGFEIRRAADTDKLRRPVFKTTETSYPAAYRGTVAIVDSGSGSGASRKGVVRITPGVAFAAGDRLEYLRGEASAIILEPRDVTARLFLNMLIEHIPGLYFPADTYPFYGVPVRPRPPMMTLT